MVKKRAVRFEFFQVNGKYTEGKNVTKGLYDLYPLADEINRMKNMTDRDVTLFGEKVRMDRFFEINSSPELYAIHFTRLRNDKPAYVELNNEILKEIPLNPGEYIAEDISCLYDKELSVLMVQRNIHSLSPSGIEEYFTEMSSDGIEIELMPVVNKEIISKALANEKFRKIELRAASANSQTNNNPLRKMLGPFVDLFDSFEGTNFVIEISAGRSKKDLSETQMKEVINAIKEDKSLFSSAIVSAKKSKEIPIEKYDLLNGKLYVYRSFDLPDGAFLRTDSVIDNINAFYFRPNEGGYRKQIIDALK
ncbi:hypothetical protein A5881_002963 [Enterococcus termitis]|nr:hypothetical protein A5881_002381 [Enterococcus termitis]